MTRALSGRVSPRQLHMGDVDSVCQTVLTRERRWSEQLTDRILGTLEVQGR